MTPDSAPTPAQRERRLLVGVRNGVIMIMQALIDYYGMSWTDFIPRRARETVTPGPAWAPTVSTPAGTFER
jgi:hypothetical protein